MFCPFQMRYVMVTCLAHGDGVGGRGGGGSGSSDAEGGLGGGGSA